MNFLNLFTEDQIPEVESEFSKVIDSGIKEPVKVVNTVLSNTINSKGFISDVINENRPAALDYIKTLLNIPEKKEVSNPIPELQRIEIDPEFKTLITEPRPEETAQLEESLIHEGCRDPLVLWGNILLDGHHRHEICLRNSLPFKTVQAAVKDREEAQLWIIKNQLGKRNLSDYDRGVLALKLKEKLSFEASKRKSEAMTQMNELKKEGILDLSHIGQTEEKIDALKTAAEIAGVGRSTMAKIAIIEEKAPPELKEQVRKGNITVNKACHKIKQSQNYQEKKQVNLKEYLQGKYDVIYSDPPWMYNNSEIRGSAEEQYPTMTIQEICSLPVKDYTATNAVLFLWTTNPHLEESFKVIKAWGFEYKTNFARIKRNQTGGFHNFGKHELLLIATKGTHITPENPQETLRSSVIHDPEDFKIEHSRKPDTYYELIEAEYPGRRYLELFARAKRPGWEVFSNEPELRAA